MKCPHENCTSDGFDSQNALNIHYAMSHDGSLAKDETDCENCGDNFSYYPSQKEGILCESCLNNDSVSLSSFRERRTFSDSDGENRECPNCETINSVTPAEAEENDRTFCGEDCYDEYRRKNSLVETNCGDCGDDMTIKRYRYEQSENNYCSDECQWNSMRKEKVTIECENCEKEKEKYPSHAERVNKNFCSEKCRIEYKGDSPRVEVQCEKCETTFDKLNCEVERTETHFCTRDCRYEYYSSEEFNHDNYGRGFSEMKAEVHQRDDFECQICGRDEDDIGHKPSVHHITPVEWFIATDGYRKRDAHYVDNGVLLCPKHHGKVDWGVIDLEEHIDDELAEKLELENPIED